MAAGGRRRRNRFAPCLFLCFRNNTDRVYRLKNAIKGWMAWAEKYDTRWA